MLDRSPHGIAVLRVLNTSLTTKSKSLFNLKEIIDIHYVLAQFLSPQELCRLSMTSHTWNACIDGVCWQQCVLSTCGLICPSPSTRRMLNMPALVWKDVWKNKWMCECVTSVGDFDRCMVVMKPDGNVAMKVRAAWLLSQALEEKATESMSLDYRLVASMIAEAIYAIAQESARQYTMKTRSLLQNLKSSTTLASYLLSGQLDAVTFCKLTHDELRNPPLQKMVCSNPDDVPYLPPTKRAKGLHVAQ